MQTSHVSGLEGKGVGLEEPFSKAFFDDESYGMFNKYKVLEIESGKQVPVTEELFESYGPTLAYQ